MKATLCDKCMANCGKHVYAFDIKGPHGCSSIELCASCALPFRAHVPDRALGALPRVNGPPLGKADQEAMADELIARLRGEPA